MSLRRSVSRSRRARWSRGNFSRAQVVLSSMILHLLGATFRQARRAHAFHALSPRQEITTITAAGAGISRDAFVFAKRALVIFALAFSSVAQGQSLLDRSPNLS